MAQVGQRVGRMWDIWRTCASMCAGSGFRGLGVKCHIYNELRLDPFALHLVARFVI